MLNQKKRKKIRDMDIKTLQSATDYVLDHLPRYPGIFWPSFVYDDLLPEDCYTSLRNGCADGIKLIIGTTKNESTFFNIMHECPKNKEEVKKMLENNGMIDKFEAIEDFYYQKKKGGDSTPTLNFSRDYMFVLGSTEVADILSQRHQEVWMYRFDFMPILPRLMGMKATHGIDVHCVFNNPDILTGLLWLFTRPSSQTILYQTMHHSWLNFIKTGNPNGEHLTIEWEKYDVSKRKTLLIDRNSTLVENPEKETIEFWTNVIKTHRFYA